MSHGLIAKNSSGSVQIDSEYENLVLLKSGSVTNTYTQSSGCGQRQAFVSWDFNANPEAILCARPKGSDQLWAIYPQVNLGRFTINFRGSYSSIDYAVYGKQQTPARGPGNWGLEVFDGNGSTVFDSRYSYLRVLGYVDLNVPAAPDLGLYSRREVNNPYSNYNPYMMQPPAICDSVVVGAGGLREYVNSWVSLVNGKVRVDNYSFEPMNPFRVFLVKPPVVI